MYSLTTTTITMSFGLCLRECGRSFSALHNATCTSTRSHDKSYHCAPRISKKRWLLPRQRYDTVPDSCHKLSPHPLTASSNTYTLFIRPWLIPLKDYLSYPPLIHTHTHTPLLTYLLTHIPSSQVVVDPSNGLPTVEVSDIPVRMHHIVVEMQKTPLILDTTKEQVARTFYAYKGDSTPLCTELLYSPYITFYL